MSRISRLWKSKYSPSDKSLRHLDKSYRKLRRQLRLFSGIPIYDKALDEVEIAVMQVDTMLVERDLRKGDKFQQLRREQK